MSRIPCAACSEPLCETPWVEGSDPFRWAPGRFSVHLCSRCGSGRTAPLIPSDELGQLYPPTYGAHRLPTNRALKLAAALLYRSRYWWALRRGAFESLAGVRPGRLLDVGSGRGDLALVLGRRGWHVTGLDPSEEACEEARSRGVPSELGTLTTIGDRLPSDNYDAIVFHHSLEHVAEPEEDLVVAHRLLRGDGHLIVAVPNFASWLRPRFGATWAHLDLPRHRSHFSPRGLDILLRRCGFAEMTVKSSSCAEGLPWSVQYRLLGGRRLSPGPGRLAMTGVAFALLPLTVAVNRVMKGRGDVLTAVAVKRVETSGDV